MLYHVNHKGEVGVCRASTNCPFGSRERHHYETAQEARSTFEESMLEMSPSGKLLLEKQLVHRQILKEANLGTPFEKIEELIRVRESLNRELEAHEVTDHPGATARYLKEYSVRGVSQTSGSERYGLSNNLLSMTSREEDLLSTLDEASEAWLKRCSDKEVQAVRRYANDSEDYAKAAEDTPDRVLLAKALDKAPNLEATLYSGLSIHQRDSFLKQLAESRDRTVEFTRAQSASANPAQVNGFMRSDPEREDDPGEIAVQVTTHKAAPMTMMSQAPYEFEVLLPPGRYHVTEVESNVTFYWDDGKLGRTAKRLYHLRQL